MKNLKIFAGEIPALSADQEGQLRGGFAMFAGDNRDIDNYCKNVCRNGPPAGTNDCVNDCAPHCGTTPVGPSKKPGDGGTPSKKTSTTWGSSNASIGFGVSSLF